MNKVLILSLALIAVVLASSHSEAPGTVSSPRSDLTDVYLFRSYKSDGSRDDYVNMMFNINPLQETFAGPNYSPVASDYVYNFHIDNDGDAVEDLTFQFLIGARFYGDFDAARGIHQGKTIEVGGQQMKIPLAHFGQIMSAAEDESVLNYWEEYRLRVFRGASADNSMVDNGPFATDATGNDKFRKPFDNAGTKTYPNGYESYANEFIHTVNIPECPHPARVFVGQREEPFYINLGNVFDLLNFSPAPAEEVLPAPANDPKFNMLKDKAITTFGVEIHKDCVARAGGNGVIGGWASVQSLKHVGANHAHKATTQKTRLGAPLINELLIGLTDKDGWNKQHPSHDSQYVGYYQRPTVPALVELLFGDTVRTALGAPNAGSLAPQFYPRVDLVQVLLNGVPGVNQMSASQPQSDMLRLNVTIPPTRRANQNSIGIVVPEGETSDAAGYPNGRRPGDDTVDITLRVAMGRLCHPPYNTAFGICQPSQAPIGGLKLTDRAPISAMDFHDDFPFFNAPIPGSQLRCSA